MKERIGWILLVGILVIWGIRAGGGMYSLKKENRDLRKENKIKEYEIKEYESEIKTITEIAKNSTVSYDTIALQSFDSTRAAWKRHFKQLRLD